MDFNYSEEQEAVRQLAGQIFGERSTHDRLKQLEAEAGDEGPFDRDLWRELAGAGLLGIHLSEDVGGAGLDFVAACLVIEAAGRTAAYVPVVETMVYGAVPIARFGTDAQRKAWLTGVASGETVLTTALAELVGEVILPGGTEPATTATAQPDGTWLLSGTKACVPAALRGGRHLGAGDVQDRRRCGLGHRRLHRRHGRRRRHPDRGRRRRPGAPRRSSSSTACVSAPTGCSARTPTAPTARR